MKKLKRRDDHGGIGRRWEYNIKTYIIEIRQKLWTGLKRFRTGWNGGLLSLQS
jgi:hypothetical protein